MAGPCWSERCAVPGFTVRAEVVEATDGPPWLLLRTRSKVPTDDPGPSSEDDCYDEAWVRLLGAPRGAPTLTAVRVEWTHGGDRRAARGLGHGVLSGEQIRHQMPIARAHFILYVRDQRASAAFYQEVLQAEPVLDVPGMTEFALRGGVVLGLMPEAGIARLLPGYFVPAGSGAFRAELYLVVPDPGACHARALAAGAQELSPLAPRDWGAEVAYSLDPDGHVLAFASGP